MIRIKDMRSQQRGVIYTLLVISTLSACGRHHGKEKKPQNDKIKKSVPVTVTYPQSRTLQKKLHTTTTIEARSHVEVYAKSGGILEAVYVDLSDRIAKGAPLARLETAQLQLASKRARAEVEHLTLEEKRSAKMHTQGILSSEDLELLRHNLKQARIALEQAELDLRDATIGAPIRGVISEKMIHVGDHINPSDHLFTIVDDNDLIANLHLPEHHLARIQLGQKVELSSDTFAPSSPCATVENVSPVINAHTGTFDVRIKIDRKNHGLKPGMLIHAAVILATQQDSLCIPKSAILYEKRLPYVYVVLQDMKVRKTRITLGIEDGQYVEVLHGISPGQRIVTTGQFSLNKEITVKIVEELSSLVPHSDGFAGKMLLPRPGRRRCTPQGPCQHDRQTRLEQV